MHRDDVVYPEYLKSLNVAGLSWMTQPWNYVLDLQPHLVIRNSTSGMAVQGISPSFYEGRLEGLPHLPGVTLLSLRKVYFRVVTLVLS